MNNIITLSNGLRIANFSSPHSFTFEDGSILPAVDKNVSIKLSMDPVEIDLGFNTIKVSFVINDDVAAELDKWMDLADDDKIDYVIVPRPLIDALRTNVSYKWDDAYLHCSPFRTIRLVDRINKICSINKFCI